MRIKRLNIGDFGIFQNQTLEDLSPGLVIIGGYNRAGKSTFMQVLRYLGYGIPSGGSIPPANVEYMVDADLWDEETDKNYYIRLQGHSEPVCTIGGEGNRISASQLYPVDAFTYKNLYTISLDQLARQPEGISDKDMDKLQSALLGAGLVDIANIPRLKDKFTSNAENIGGKTGRLSNKAFKSQVDIIRKGIAIKNNALAQVDEYQKQKKHLKELEDQKQALNKELNKKQARRDILETVLSNYDVLDEVIGLDHSLEYHEGLNMPKSLKWENKSRVEEAWQSWGQQKERWQDLFDQLMVSLGDRDTAEKIQTLLLSCRVKLQNFIDRLSGLQEKWNSLDSAKRRIKEEKQRILARIKQLNNGWTEKAIDQIRDLKLEWSEQQHLMGEVNRFQGVENKLEQAEKQLKEVEDKIDVQERRLKEWDTQAPIQGLKLYLWISIISAVLGLAVSFIKPALGIFLGLFGILGSALFVFVKGLGQKDASLRTKEIKADLEGLLTKQEKLKQEIKELTEEREEIESYFTDICNKLGLNVSTPPNSLYEYYRIISDIQGRILSLDHEEKEMQEQSAQLAHQLKAIDQLTQELEKASGSKEEHNTASYDVMQSEAWVDIQARLKNWHSLMNTAVQLEHLSEEMKKTNNRILGLMGQENNIDSAEISLEDRVENYLAQCQTYAEYQEMRKRREILLQSLERTAASTRVQKAFSLLSPNEEESSLLEQLFITYNQFPAKDSLKREYDRLLNELKSIEDQLEKCKNDILETKHLLEQLSHTEKLEQAHEMIQRGRNGLYQVSYDYAVQKAAAWLCRQIRNEFMTRMKDELLIKADGILKKLTGEDYQRIIPNEDLSDFTFELKDGSQQVNSQILSRGTREQVFLAVRLGRILEMNPPLPVIIDDSLVNFDCDHLKSAVEVIGSLSRTHQVFIMTCHPHLVEHFANISSDYGLPAQFWRLDKGRIFPSEGLELMKYLS